MFARIVEESHTQHYFLIWLYVQVEFANVIVVNKADLVSREHMNTLKGILKNLNPDAKIIETIRSDVSQHW